MGPYIAARIYSSHYDEDKEIMVLVVVVVVVVVAVVVIVILIFVVFAVLVSQEGSGVASYIYIIYVDNIAIIIMFCCICYIMDYMNSFYAQFLITYINSSLRI